MAYVLDYSAGTPGAKAIKAFGAIGVNRYAGTPGRKKNLTRAEFVDLDRAGLGVATVYENQPGDYLGGYPNGQRAARAWLADVSGIDERLARIGHFAVDKDVVSEWDKLADYFRGIASVIGVARTRGYGEADVVDYLVAHRLVSNGEHGGQWQTVAWSRGRRSQYAALYQRAEQPSVGGIACDINEVLAPDWGQHNYQEDDMQQNEKAVDPGPGTVGHNLLNVFQQVNNKTYGLPVLGAKVGALTTAVAKLAADPNIDEAKLAQLLDEAVAEHTPSAEENAAAFLPMITDAVHDALGEDNADQADAIVNAIVGRLQKGAV